MIGYCGVEFICCIIGLVYVVDIDGIDDVGVCFVV